MNYEKRIVCFLDILGFKEFIKNTVNDDRTDNEQAIDELRKALNIMRHYITPSDSEEWEVIKSKQVTQFSDCIVVSFLYSEESGVFNALLEIQWTLGSLVQNGILCRGGIALGKLIHTENLLFGPALIDAYLCESKCANYPRVIVPDEIIDVGKKFHSKHHGPDMEEEGIKEIIKKDYDGMYYIDYFEGIQSEFDDPEYDYPLYLNKLSTIIANGLKSKIPNIKIKYLWMKEKYNFIVNNIKNNIDKWDNDILEEEIKNCYKSLPIF